jgi:GAF domain-containing protein
VTTAPDPVLQAVLEAAVDGTGGSDGWLLGVRGDQLHVMAASSSLAPSVMGTAVPADAGTAGFVIGSGHPIAIAPRGDDPRASTGVAAAVGRRPASVLSVPCHSDDGVAGVLEVVDKAGGGMFTFDDVELATLLAGIAGVALAQEGPPRLQAPAPDEVAGELRRLAESDPGRYAAVANVLSALIASG